MHSSSIKRASLLYPTFFAAAYLLMAAGYALVTHNWEFVIYIVVVLLCTPVALYAHRHIRFSQPIVWGIAVWGLLHMFGGLVPVPQGWPIDTGESVFYSWWIIPGILKYDMLIHAYGFGIATVAIWQSIQVLLTRSASTPGVLLLAILASVGIGALNEMIEFFTTLVLPHTNVGGYVNTGWDLFFNLVGSLIAACVIFQRSRLSRRTP